MLNFTPWKTAMIWLVTLASLIFAMPNVIPASVMDSLPTWVPRTAMTLGLDLQGGSHIMLKLERTDIVKERLNTVVDDVRTTLREKGIGYSNLNGTGQVVRVTIRDMAKLEEAKTELAKLAQPIQTGTITGTSITELDMQVNDATGQVTLNLTDAGIDYRVASAAQQSMEVVRRRVDELGTTEPVIQRQGTDRLIVQVPGLQDPQRLKSLLNQTAKLSFHLVDPSMTPQDAINGRPPATSEVVYSMDDPPIPYLLQKRAIVSGDNLVDAQAAFDQQTGEAVVNFRFDNQGAQRFGKVTQEHIGEPFAIVLDNQVITAPVIRSAILGGSGQISGNFNAESANDLAVLLRAGALPATLTVVEERTVGPGLGQDSINAGFTAGVIGCIFVVAFMMYFYGFLGLIANIAMFLNVIMIIAILSLLGATLTLPGIAGIVLTIGQAVDSNVLVYERFREELKAGRPFIQAMDAGFNRAIGTILDANITTLIAAIILFYMGTGPVRGFAVTLTIGIITTVFTAVTLSRWMIATWIKVKRPKTLPKGVRTGMFDGTNIRFMGVRNYTFALSAFLAIASVVGFGMKGLNLGIDFVGGSIIEVKAKQGEANIGDIREKLSGLNLGEVQVQSFGSNDTALIRVQAQNSGESAEQTVITKVRGELEGDYEFRRVEVVGPSVSGELASAGIIGVTLSLLGIVVYIWIRFEWQFAIGAIIATIHDVIMTIGLFVFTGIEFNLTSIAAVLTIVGYSLNDTVVVYDRMRENLRRYKKMPLPLLIDTSINQTLSRTILTSVTTMLALIALVAFGGEVIRSFTVAILFGVVVGTFSSIYMAAPVLIIFKLRPDVFDKKDEDAKEGKSETAGA